MQQPSKDNPIFLPSDSEAEWLLAKMFIKNIDTMFHQAIYHFQATHCVSEVVAVSTFRNFPVIHPMYKVFLHSYNHAAGVWCMFDILMKDYCWKT